MEITPVQGDSEARIEVEIERPDGSVDKREVKAPGRLELHPGNSQSVRVATPGYWSPPLSLDGAEEDLELVLWPATEIVGTISVPEGSVLPGSIGVRIESHRGEGEPRLEETAFLCPMGERGDFRCSVPRLHADLRLRVPGYASRFYWDLDLDSEEPVALGEVPLRPGASVVGWLEGPRAAELGEVVLQLRPGTRSPFPDDHSERAAEELTTKPDALGFFSFEGLAPGVYRLAVEHPRLAAADPGRLRVLEGAQTELTEPIRLMPAEPLEISVEPLRDPYGDDWTLEVRSTGDRTSQVAEGVVEAGFWRGPKLAPGEYRVWVRDSEGDKRAEAIVSHGTGTGPHPIEVSTVRVEGTVTLGDEPLVSRLTFRGELGSHRMETDGDGAFTGFLPQDGLWDVAIEAPIPRVEWRRRISLVAEDGVAVVEIELPDTELRGETVDARGEPVPKAEVTAVDAPAGIGVTIESDADGRFAFYGLSETPHWISARRRELQSVVQTVEVREGLDQDVRLVLVPMTEIEGRVLDSAGNPVPGAWLLAEPYAAPGIVYPGPTLSVNTDATGEFRGELPPGTPLAAVTVFVPGHALRHFMAEPGDLGDVVVRPEGGTLLLETPPEVPWRDASRRRPMVIHPTGHKAIVGLLVRWGQMNGLDRPPPTGPFEIPLLTPGPYQVCWVGPEEHLTTATLGTGCVGGEVSAEGTLSLRLGEAPSAATPDP